MKQIGKKIYYVKKPSHPAEAHTKSKRFFKKKSRKKARSYLKKLLKREEF
jgi:hypothetical protein